MPIRAQDSKSEMDHEAAAEGLGRQRKQRVHEPQVTPDCFPTGVS